MAPVGRTPAKRVGRPKASATLAAQRKAAANGQIAAQNANAQIAAENAQLPPSTDDDSSQQIAAKKAPRKRPTSAANSRRSRSVASSASVNSRTRKVGTTAKPVRNRKQKQQSDLNNLPPE